MRPWIVSAVAVAILVAGTLVYLDRDGDDAGNGGGTGRRVVERTPPQLLAEADIRKYIEVMPELDAMLGRITEEFRRHIEGGGTQEQFGAYSQQRISELLARHHLTRASFEQLRRRVEHVVDILRYEQESEQRNRELDEKIAEKEQALAIMKQGQEKSLLEQDVKALKKKRAEAPPPVNPEDRALARSFWRDLDRAVPRTAPPIPGK